MRHVLIALLFLLLSSLFAGPIPIRQITHEWHEMDYYVSQVEEWKAVVADPEHYAAGEMAWYHYYLAAHFANVRGHEPAFNLSAIHQEAETQLEENDFALHYLRCRQSATPELRWKNLLKAHEVAPERVEAYPGLAIYYLLEGKIEQYREFMRKIDARNPFPAGAVAWSYNQLQSVEQGGVLITHGDNDTYATLMLQAVYEVRPDIAVINLSLFTFFPDYRDRLARELSLAPFTFADTQPDSKEVLSALLTSNRPVYLGVGAHDRLISGMAERMYLTGLTYRYAEADFNNLGALVDNYRNAWRLSELFHPLETGGRRAVTDLLNQNYLPALLELREHFLTTDPEEARKLETTVRVIAEKSDLTYEVEQFLRPEISGIASGKVELKAKQIDKWFREIPAGEYKRRTDAAGAYIPLSINQEGEMQTHNIRAFRMQETEVSNARYQMFLEDLLRQRRFDLLDSAAIAEADYNAFIPADQQDPNINSLYRERNELLSDHPITSISHRAAEMYAVWLGEVYNNDPKRKDERRVRFRLPTAEEIEYAARGGRSFSPFPWGGPYIANAKGCLLANFNTTIPDDHLTNPNRNYLGIAGRETQPDTTANTNEDCLNADDGGRYTVATDAYFPNDFGLYNMSGNAAEMTSRPGIDVGGSWADAATFMEIGIRQRRKAPHPAVGFRLVMEYVD